MSGMASLSSRDFYMYNYIVFNGHLILLVTDLDHDVIVGLIMFRSSSMATTVVVYDRCIEVDLSHASGNRLVFSISESSSLVKVPIGIMVCVGKASNR